MIAHSDCLIVQTCGFRCSSDARSGMALALQASRQFAISSREACGFAKVMNNEPPGVFAKR